MSHVATAWAYRQPIDNPGRKFVLVALADFADEAWSCYPGQERLAAMTGQTSRSVRTHLARLEDDGLIQREARFLTNGRRTSDRYVLAGPTTEQPPENPSGGDTPEHRKITSSPPENPSGDPLENHQSYPLTPSELGERGRRPHCTQHRRWRAGCADCDAEANPRPQRPRWCGHCHPDTRMVDDEHPRRCPACHPKAAPQRRR